VALLSSGAAADVVTEQSASILVFPKVVADGTRDTIIQITNTSNSMVHAHCFYVNGALTFPDQDPGPNNPPLWTEIDFDIWLTKQQPTQWVVSEGRLVDPTDATCNRDNEDCPTAGFDPGRVPPVVEDFTGELKCIEVDGSGAPLSGNHLKGEATIFTRNICDDGTCVVSGESCSTDDDCDEDFIGAAKYNGLGVIGLETNNGDGILCLGGEPNASCENGAEYNACPQTWILNHLADGAEDPVAGEGSEVHTTITVIPCTQNFETQVPESVIIQFAITNEFEQTFSASTTVTCWAELDLEEINEVFTRDFVGSDFIQTRMRPSSGTASGFMVVADALHVSPIITGTGQVAVTNAWNLHVEETRTGPDTIVIPAEQLPPLP
jgi:hypothetical protein